MPLAAPDEFPSGLRATIRGGPLRGRHADRPAMCGRSRAHVRSQGEWHPTVSRSGARNPGHDTTAGSQPAATNPHIDMPSSIPTPLSHSSDLRLKRGNRPRSGPRPLVDSPLRDGARQSGNDLGAPRVPALQEPVGTDPCGVSLWLRHLRACTRPSLSVRGQVAASRRLRGKHSST